MSTKDDDALELAVESALAEYLMRCDEGDAPNREQFLARNPQMRDQLESILAAADWIEQMAGPTAVETIPAIPPELALLGKESLPEGQTVRASSSSIASPGKPSPLNMVTDPNEDTQPLLPRMGARIAPSIPGFSEATADPNAATLPTPTLPTSNQSIVPSFSLGSLTPAQELLQPVLPCRFGDYVLEKVLGRGGMGVVYAGRQVHLDRAVAIKMIRSGALASSEEVQRFYTEARSAAQLDHPNIVTVYQCGEHEGHHYFSMDLVGGTDLAKIIQNGPMDFRRAARYVRDVARAIEFAHARGILHRDLKPANVLVDDNDQVHVTDFGLAKAIGHDTGLTATGAALGTPSYMSPEQAAGRTDEHAPQTDVYSLGAVLFASVTGKPPFQCPSVVQTIMQVLHRPAPLARQIHAAVPLDLETIIAKCLHKSPDRRYPSAQALANDLDRYLRDEPIQARPISPFRRALYWSMGIPIVGALLGRRVIEPSRAHTWTQRGILIGMLVCLAVLSVWWPLASWQSQKLPATIRFAAGQAGGSYDFVGRAICTELARLTGRPAVPEITEGSNDNRQRLIDRKVDLALLQANTLKSHEIAIIAPLYYEAIHVLVRTELEIHEINDLAGRSIIIGPEQSGSRSVARRILHKHGMELTDIQPAESDWISIDHQPTVDAAIVIVQVGNMKMNELLGSGQFKLLALDDAIEFSLDDPSFRLLPITRDHYPDAELPDGGVNSIATTAFLTTRIDSPDVLVQKALEAIYAPDVRAAGKLLSPETVADWQVAWHRAAEAFFERYRVQP